MQRVAELQVPESLTEPAEKVLEKRKRRLTPGKLLLLSLALFVLTLAAEGLLENLGTNRQTVDFVTTFVGGAGFGLSTLLALAASVTGVIALFRGPRSIENVLLNLTIAGAGFMMTWVGLITAWISTFGFARGRQLRRFGRVLLPPVRAGGSWVDSGFTLDGAACAPVGLAEQWRENGRTEHASVASFARLTLDLMALGAPPTLVAAANHDALDEIQHTEACFALAHALDGRAESPGPFPEAQRAHSLPRSRWLALAQLAVLSLVDGALHEGVSARVIAKLARRCQNPGICRILKQIAADEGRHAAHGWDVVEWCLEQGGAPVAHALAGAVRVLPEQLRSNLPDAAAAGAWEPWGIHGHALESEEYAAARTYVVERTHQLVTRALELCGASRAA